MKKLMILLSFVLFVGLFTDCKKDDSLSIPDQSQVDQLARASYIGSWQSISCTKDGKAYTLPISFVLTTTTATHNVGQGNLNCPKWDIKNNILTFYDTASNPVTSYNVDKAPLNNSLTLSKISSGSTFVWVFNKVK